MITLTQRQNGTTVAIHTPSHHTPTSHGHSTTSRGWTKATARRMRNKMMDVQTGALTHPHALTLTMSEAHARPQHLTSAIKQVQADLTALGMTGWAWTVEFTKNHVPHLHALASFTVPPDPESIARAWTDALTATGTTGTLTNQRVTPAYDPSGWLRYMSKSAGRGNAYYAERHTPDHWASAPRLYACTLPTTPATRTTITRAEFDRIRREMDAHNEKRYRIQPPRFRDARDEVTGRTAWAYHVGTRTATTDHGRHDAHSGSGSLKNMPQKTASSRSESRIRPYILKEGRTRNEKRPISSDRALMHTVAHKEASHATHISMSPWTATSALTPPVQADSSREPRLFFEFSLNRNTNLERTAKTDPPHHRGRNARDTRGAPRPQNPHAAHQPAPPHSTRPAPRAPPPHVRAHPCARLRSHACRYSSCRPPAHAPDDSTPTTQGDAP